MPINTPALNYPLASLPFRSSLQSFRYLGINVTKNFSDLFDHNFVPLLNRLSQDFNRWSLLPISLIGRVNCIKMSVLLKFLYLFQCIPIFIPKFFFFLLHLIALFLVFFGIKKPPPKIRKGILQKTKQLGGLALSNFRTYCWAANICTTLYWFQPSNSVHSPPWLHIENASCKSSSLAALLCLLYTLSPMKYSINIIVKNSLKIWTRHFGLHNTPLLSPIHSNTLFHPTILDSAYTSWRDLGLVSIADLYIDGVFASFEQLTSQFNISKKHFFKYLQI